MTGLVEWRQRLWFGVVICALVGGAAAQGIPYVFHGDPGDEFGRSVSGAGDVNGDGFDDFVVGANDDDDPTGLTTGSATVYSGIDGSVLHIIYGDGQRDLLGWSVSGGVDVNNDGFSDLIVGVPWSDDIGYNHGMVRAHSGRDGTALYLIYGDSDHDKLGWSVSGAGDVNNDGFADFIAGAYLDDDTGVDAGSARVFSGQDGSALYTFYGDATEDEFGATVSDAGDVNGDGHTDLIVGSRLNSTNGIYTGMARVLSGKDGTVLHSFYGDVLYAGLGTSVSGAGDLNGDGFADVMAGAPSSDVAGRNAGSAYVFSGSDGSTLHTFHGEFEYDGIGGSVSDLGDVTGDGVDDVIVGAPECARIEVNSGMAQIYSGADGILVHTFLGDGTSRFGFSVSGAGDLNGDGFPEVVVGAPQDRDIGFNSGIARVFDLGCPGSFVSYGHGCPGTGHFTPKLRTLLGCATLNDSVTVEVKEGLAGAHAMLLLGSTEASISLGGDCHLLMSPIHGVAGFFLGTSGAGYGRATLTGTVCSGYAALGTAKLQVAVIDPGGFNGYSMTNGVSLEIR